MDGQWCRTPNERLNFVMPCLSSQTKTTARAPRQTLKARTVQRVQLTGAWGNKGDGFICKSILPPEVNLPLLLHANEFAGPEPCVC
jgi:hypothetical protein